jgi:ankyrin repeat protein
LEHVKKYFSDGGDVNQKIDDGKTPLMLAIRHSYNSSIDGYNIDAVKFILNKKPNISVKDEDGEAAIHHGNLNPKYLNFLQTSNKSKFK